MNPRITLILLIGVLGFFSARFAQATTPCNPVFRFIGLSKDGNQLYWERRLSGECDPMANLFQYDFSKKKAQSLYYALLEEDRPDPQDPQLIPLSEYKKRKLALLKTLQTPPGAAKISLRPNPDEKSKKGAMILESKGKRCALPDPVYSDWEEYLVFPAKGVKTAHDLPTQQILWVVTRHCNLANAPLPRKTCPEDEGLALYSKKSCE